MTANDLDLLRQFTREHSQDAFTTLVQRHVNLVYSAAFRQVRSPQLAEEIAQSVFADLARDAGRLKPGTILTAWLYQVARRTGIDAVRKESRRQLREQIATEMNVMNAQNELPHFAKCGNDSAWPGIEPLLDEAMSALDHTDRSAILLRYFENKNLREVGEALGTSDDAAQKRVSRAVEQLREFFAKRGVTVGAGGLVVVISANAVQAAPVGLAAVISTAAVLAGTAVHTSTIISATKTIAMTTLQKTFIAAALSAAIGTGIYEAHQASELREQNQTLQQQQTPLAEQIQQLQRERDDAANRLAGLLAENSRLKSNPHEMELLKLRGEVTQLRNNAQHSENDPTVQLAHAWKAKAAKLRQLFEQTPDQRIPEMQLLSDEQWLDVAKNADLDSTRGIRIALSRIREVATLNFAAAIQQALHTYMNANQKKLPDTPSQLTPYFRPPVENADAMLLRYQMLDKEAQTKEAFKGASIIQKVLIDNSVDNTLIVGLGTMGFAPKPNQGHAPVDIPRELLPVLKAYMDANNHKTPLDFDELKPYITTPEQTTALDKFIKVVTE